MLRFADKIKYLNFALLLVVALPFLTLTPVLHAQDEQNQEKLDDLNQEITQLRERIDSLESDQKNTIRTIEQLKMKRRMHRREIEVLDIRKEQTDTNISELETTISENEQSIANKKDKVGIIFRKMFVNGRYDMLKALMSVKSAKDLGLAHSYLTFLAKKDIRLIAEYRGEILSLGENRNQLQTERENLERMIGEEKEHANEARKAENEQERILTRIREDKDTFIQLLEEKNVARQQLVGLINQLSADSEMSEETVQPSVPFPDLQKKLPWPVKGKILTYYGIIKDKTYDVEVQNDGIDIQADIGSSVQAVADGKVLYSDWHDAIGNMVVLDHGKGYYTLYAHLSRFDVANGDQVKQGQMIGAVGETGSLIGPVLTFEIRQIRNGQDMKTLNPMNWLEKLD